MFTPENLASDLGELGISGIGGLFGKLDAAYGGSDRHYHNRGHIADCLTKFAQLRELAEHPAEVICAIWFHDAVYDSRRSDNEESSADWAERVLREHAVTPERITRVRELILATKTHVVTSPDSALLLDVDLSILGSDPETFAAYDTAIRKEYAWVSDAEYRTARAKVLQAFLDRPAIFRTDIMHQRFEEPARSNLVRALR